MIASVTAESIIEKKEEPKAGRENGFIGISQPFCGNRMRDEKARKRRIVNGETTTPGEHPWIVAIAYKKRVGCGGTIMTANYVITAAHCVGGEPRDSIVLAGVHDLDHLARQRPEKVNKQYLERIQGITRIKKNMENFSLSSNISNNHDQ